MQTRPPTILQEIVHHKRREIKTRQELVPIADLRVRIDDLPPPRPFVDAIAQRVEAGNHAVIAEIKKASPSKGVLRKKFDPADIAVQYEQHGATCMSVLTDEKYFQGSDADLKVARAACHLPTLRKDFVIDAYQVYESRALGADCILLILAILDDLTLQMLAMLAANLGMGVLLEVHNQEELERALKIPTRLLGINNRDLHTFETALQTTFSLLELVDDNRIVITESGISTPGDIALMRENGVHGFLVGEAFMRAKRPGEALEALFRDY